jgi:hypothetical protein
MEAWAEAVSHRLGERVVLAEGEVASGWASAAIALSIDEVRVEVAVHLPPGDARALRARIVDPLFALEVTTALEALPEQFGLGLGEDEASREPAGRFSADRLRALLDRAESEHASLWLGWSIPRDVAVEHAVLLDEQLEDAVVALGAARSILAPPLVRSEGASAPRALAGGKRDRRHVVAADDERGAGTTKRRARARERKRERDGELRSEREAPEQAPAPRVPLAREGPRPSAGRPRPRAGASAGKRIEKGARVRVLEGPFSGKVGIVQELDGKGGARVMLGLLAVRLEIADLARCAEGKTRPILSSSHRKPAPARS